VTAAHPAVGDRLPTLRRVLRGVDLVVYAGATWDWHRLHHDEAYAADHGLPRPIVDGQMLGALLAEQVQDHLGIRARVTAMRFRFATLVYADDEIEITGEVTGAEELEDGRVRVSVTQTITCPGGTAIRDAVTVAEVRP
jgi:acyl dehydratase